MKHLVLFSAGLDSTVILYDLIAEFGAENVVALIADYNQVNKSELEKAVVVCSRLGIKMHYEKFSFINSDNRGEVYARNLIFLSKATELSCVYDYENIYIGSCADDIYTDSSLLFTIHFNRILELYGKSLVAPLKKLTKTSILEKAINLEVDMHLVHSCREDKICFKCKTCEQLKQAYNDLGLNYENYKNSIIQR